MFICYYVSKAYVLPFDNKGNESTLLPKGDYTLFKFLAANLEFFCLTQKPHPVRRPPLCRRGAGGEAVPRKRENQINTLVLKDINFTINIIELSYYRTIDTLNQSKNAPVVKASPSPSKGGDVLILLTYFHRFKLYPTKTSPPLEGLGEAFFPNLPLVLPLLYSPFLSVRE